MHITSHIKIGLQEVFAIRLTFNLFRFQLKSNLMKLTDKLRRIWMFYG